MKNFICARTCTKETKKEKGGEGRERWRHRVGDIVTREREREGGG